MFFDEMVDKLNLSGATKHTYNISNFSGKLATFLGTIKIIQYTKTKLVFVLSDITFTCIGKNLNIHSFTQSSLSVMGEIDAIYNSNFK